MDTIKTAAQLACVDIYVNDPTTYFDRLIVESDTLCGVKYIDGKAFVCMQGTNERFDWWDNVNILPARHVVLGILHGGFHTDINAILKKLLLELPIDVQVVMTGHSQGAAKAAIMSGYLKLANINVEHNVLFACPNAGNRVFANWLKKNIKGVSYRNAFTTWPYFGDVVPQLPFTPYVAPYEHTLITTSPKGWLNKCRPSEWHHACHYFNGVNPPTVPYLTTAKIAP